MKLRLLLALFTGLVVAGIERRVDAVELNLDQEKSTIGFVGSKPDAKHKGGFKKFTVAAIANFEDPGRSSINIQIDATSLWSDNEKLTEHLKSPDFFSIEKYPAIIFESTEIVPGEKEGDVPTATIKGNLQMLGESVAVDIPVKSKVTEEAIEVTTELTIDRTKWGMTYGEGKIDKEVKITAKLVLKR